MSCCLEKSTICTVLQVHQVWFLYILNVRETEPVWEVNTCSNIISIRNVWGLRLYVSPAPVTSHGLDKWQVVLKRVSIHCHAELHLDTLLQSGGGVVGRGGNVKAQWSAACQNIDTTGKQARHKELHSCLCVVLKGGFVSLRTWMEVAGRDSTEPPARVNTWVETKTH